MSSSLAHVALPPPPRPRRLVRPVSIDSIDSTEPGSPTLDGDDTLQLNEPEPTTPPVPVMELRGHGLSLDIPRHHIPPSIRSAPTSFSPPSFFDTIQAQPNAMDDLDESSDEDDDDDVVDEMRHHPLPLPPLHSLPDTSRTRTTSVASAPVPRPALMKFGNHSTPYTPVGNVAPKAPFFTERKADGDHSPPSSAYDFYRYAQGNPPPNAASLAAPSPSTSRTSLGDSQPGRPSFSGTVVSVSSQKAQESMKKLDGMLLQHMEAEKDTIKRIATSMKQSSLTGHGEGAVGGGLSQQANASQVSVNSIPSST
ncbi:hypothetical protein H1R20_g14691, partial [Candolleomyces eurysporus]